MMRIFSSKSYFRCEWLSKASFTVAALSVLLLVGYGVDRFSNRLTDGFSMDAISAPLKEDVTYRIKSLEDHRVMGAILSQPFHYLAKGTQSFVFVSQDKQYVLKFFKQKHLRVPWYCPILSHVPWIKHYFKRKIERRELKRAKIYSGCKLAYDEMQADTGMIYLHLNPSSDLSNQITLIDKRGKEYTADPNGLAFFIQKRGEPLYNAFIDYRARHDIEGAKQALAKVFNYLVDRSRRGILDRDPAYPQNLGFIGERAGNLDVGNLTPDPLIKNPVEYKRRIQEHLVDLRGWLLINFSELVMTYDEYLEAL